MRSYRGMYVYIYIYIYTYAFDRVLHVGFCNSDLAGTSEVTP